MAQPKNGTTEANESDTINRVIKFEPDNFEVLEDFSQAIGSDIHTVVNLAVLSLSTLEDDALITLMDNLHEQRKAKILASR